MTVHKLKFKPATTPRAVGGRLVDLEPLIRDIERLSDLAFEKVMIREAEETTVMLVGMLDEKIKQLRVQFYEAADWKVK